MCGPVFIIVWKFDGNKKHFLQYFLSDKIYIENLRYLLGQMVAGFWEAIVELERCTYAFRLAHLL